MKQIKNITSYTLLFLIATSLFSCKKNFDEVNTDPIGKSTTTANQLLAPALVNVLNANMVRNRNFNNELMQVTVDLGDAEGRIFRYDVRRNFADYTWNAWYPELTNLRNIYTIASQPATLNKSYQGISRIAEAWVFQLLTDVYGDVPYFQANQGKDGVLEPAFDKQKDIYLDLFKKLEEANTLLANNTPITATGDPVYQGDVSKWRRLGNSLYLRLLMRISGKAEVSAQVIAKIKEMVDTNPANYPLMTNNTHTARIAWNGTNSSTAVYSSPFMINVRAVDFRGPGIASFFLDNLTTWADPRIRPELWKLNINRFGIAQGPNGFVGVPSGYPSGSGPVKQAYFYSDAQITNGTTLQTDAFTGIIMNVAEVDFMLAEAAAKGWINTTGETYYYKGVADQINYWMPALYANPTDPALKTYAIAADMDWKDAYPLNAARGFKSKMQLIQLQKYYALFLVDFQQWIEYRRTGYPYLNIGTGLANGGKMPARLNYPLISQSTNPTSYKNVVAAQGTDDINTLVWWQKP